MGGVSTSSTNSGKFSTNVHKKINVDCHNGEFTYAKICMIYGDVHPSEKFKVLKEFVTKYKGQKL